MNKHIVNISHNAVCPSKSRKSGLIALKKHIVKHIGGFVFGLHIVKHIGFRDLVGLAGLMPQLGCPVPVKVRSPD